MITLHLAGPVLGWVTIRGVLFWHLASLLGQLSLAVPSWVGTMSIDDGNPTCTNNFYLPALTL